MLRLPLLSRTTTPLLLAVATLLILVPAARAEVVRVRVDSRETIPAANIGPGAGDYEKITGRLFLEVDPALDANSRITDLQLAPRNGRGRVEFSTEFELVRPLDPVHDNGRLLYFVSNRGGHGGPGFFSWGLDHDWLGSQGYSFVWCGWGCDVAESDRRFNITVPSATAGGRRLRGRVHAEIVNWGNTPAASLPLTWGGSRPHAAISTDNTGATLTRRRYRTDEPETIPNDRWSFARVADGDTVPDPRWLHVRGGIEPGWLYDVVYTSENPPLTGLGLAAIRDVVSFLRYGTAGGGGPDNPLAGRIGRAYSWGHSQSGRLLLHFVWQGFNSDERGRPVFDGVLPSCPGAGKGQFNSRFAQTTRHGSHLEDHLYPVDFFPLAFEEQTDPVTGESGHALGLARELGNAPKMMILNSATDYWTRAASLLHTDVTGTRDAAIDPSVRIYSLAGVAHDRNRPAIVGRALLTALDEWVSRGVEPPASRIPRIADGTLVDLAAVRASFPDVPGLVLPDSWYEPPRLDPGPRWKTEGVADHVPPITGPPFRTLVSQVDADGNDVAGIRLPVVAAPLATVCGWNKRNPAFSNSLGRNSGRTWPLAPDRAARVATGDPRPSLAERYPTPEAYVAKVRASLAQLLEDRLVLPVDHDRMLALAQKQSALIGRLRPIDEIAASEEPAAAADWFRQVDEADLGWYYGNVGAAINRRGYEVMFAGDAGLAERIFRINTERYPDNGNVWDSLGECLLTQRRWRESRAAYEKSLELAPGNDNARAMLARIAEEEKR